MYKDESMFEVTSTVKDTCGRCKTLILCHFDVFLVYVPNIFLGISVVLALFDKKLYTKPLQVIVECYKRLAQSILAPFVPFRGGSIGPYNIYNSAPCKLVNKF